VWWLRGAWGPCRCRAGRPPGLGLAGAGCAPVGPAHVRSGHVTSITRPRWTGQAGAEFQRRLLPSGCRFHAVPARSAPGLPSSACEAEPGGTAELSRAANKFAVNYVVATTTRTRRRGCHNDAVEPDWLADPKRRGGYRPVVTLITVCPLKTKKPICDTQDELVNLSFGRPTGLLGERGTVSPAG